MLVLHDTKCHRNKACFIVTCFPSIEYYIRLSLNRGGSKGGEGGRGGEII